MSVLQLSKITHRKGLSENLPQLAGAELGWVLDERKLYIGNGTIIEGAPVVGNTEILTEFSDILGMSSKYVYKGTAAGYIVRTGENDTDVSRALQDKFDEIVSVKSFGAVGDGVTDDTDAINRALYELFCRALNPEIRRSLYFPAGKYKVSGTIKVPPHAKLWGEGLTSSIIEFISDTDILASTVIIGNRYAITDPGNTDFTLIGAPDSNANTVFTATAAGTGTGTVRAVPAQVVETADSLQQTGLNLGTNGAITPTGIEMTEMAIYTTEENSLLKLDSVSNSGFSYLGLRGNSDVLTPAADTAAIEIASSVGPTRDVTVSKLDTQGSTYALRAAGDVRGIVLENSGLSLHYKGVYITNPIVAAVSIVAGNNYKIVALNNTDFTAIGAEFNRIGETFLASAPGAGTGTVIALDTPSPTGIVVSRNIFDNIAAEGIHFENVLFNSSGFNVFYNVGNALGANPATPVITMDTDQCVSVGDLFERQSETVFPRVQLNGNGGIYIDGSHSIHLGSYERQVGLEAQITAGTATLFANIDTLANSYKIDYAITANTSSRIGTMTVAVSDAIVQFDDQYTEAGTIGVVLDATAGANNNESIFQYTATENATINFSVVRIN